MYIFNSLGSNYDWSFVKTALKLVIGLKPQVSQTQVLNQLHQLFAADWQFTYKGRHALSLALTSLGIKPGDQVGLQAFTCWAVEEAILSVGAVPVFIDISPNSLNLNLKTLQQTYRQYPHMKALIVQHTLGFPAESKAIAAWSRRRGIFLIEDLAHSYGAKTSDQFVGTWGDATILSFGRDKIIDGVTGGAVALKTKPLPKQILTSAPVATQVQELLYPFWVYLIRVSYPLKIGKVIHYGLKRAGWLTSPVQVPKSQSNLLPRAFLDLISMALDRHATQLAHRRKIAQIYQSLLLPHLKIADFDLDVAGCLRYPIQVKNRSALLASLSKQNLYITDTWYKAPVDTSTLSVTSTYNQGNCPQAELMAQRVVNLPTHQQVSPQQARKIVKLIHNYL